MNIIKDFKDCPVGFYVYLHYRISDGEVFYVGKGKGQRIVSTKRNRLWRNIAEKHGVRASIYKDNLSEEEAFQIESELIVRFGRIDNKSGCLANLTDGGEGMSGHVRSSETIEKVRVKHIGRKLSDETKLKISVATKSRYTEILKYLSDTNEYVFINKNGNTFKGTRLSFKSEYGVNIDDLFSKKSVNSLLGWGYVRDGESTQDALQRVCNSRSLANSDKTKYHFINTETDEIFHGTRLELAAAFDLPNYKRLTELFNKKQRKSVYGWSLLKEENGTTSKAQD